MIVEAMKAVRQALLGAFCNQSLQLYASWKVSGRAISEIGGRLIEDFVLSNLPAYLDQNLGSWDSIECHVPDSGRAIEDISVTFTRGQKSIRLLIDVKGHNQLRPGSRPNLASIRKCVELYSDPSRCFDEVVVFFCRYIPSVKPGDRCESITYAIQDSSFTEKGCFLLRELSDKNLDPANIGSGGQLLLAREHEIQLVNRSRTEFLTALERLRDRLRR